MPGDANWAVGHAEITPAREHAATLESCARTSLLEVQPILDSELITREV